MTITSIGDIHGRNVWKKIVKRNVGSHFVFLGDYLDPYKKEKITEDAALENFQEIIDFKNSDPSNVTLLIGNHDTQYMFYPNFSTNSKSKLFLLEIIDIFTLNRNLFDFAYQKDNYLFVHAGISNGWFNEYRELLDRFDLKKDLSNLGVVLNRIGDDPKGKFSFSDISRYRGGFDAYGSPIWADDRELEYLSLTGIHQIVGHNKIDTIQRFGDDETSITFCDCLYSEVKELTLTFI